MKLYLYLCLFPYLLICQLTKTITLNSNWKFKQDISTHWHNAKVPGTIYSDLLNSKQIPDPYVGTNNLELSWIDTCNWDYETEFVVTQKQLDTFTNVVLKLDGIETFATVYVNSKPLTQTNNAFIQYMLPVKNKLVAGKNKLTIKFRSTHKEAKTLASASPYILPGDEKVYVRAPQYKFGWDFGPRMVGCAITQPIQLILWKDVFIESVQFTTQTVSANKAMIKITVLAHSEKQQTALLKIHNKNTSESFQLNCSLKEGETSITHTFAIQDPQLWWCNGLGKPYLYTIESSIELQNRQYTSATTKIGVRTIELVQENDPFGKSFFFKLNGIPVFIKGANCIPADIAKTDHYDHELPLIAKLHHMNMLRVWGGGVYASDSFYNACDENGILVWQDLMFACAMYPGNKEFTDNVVQEIIQQKNRLSNHASLALWCGNNEVKEGWFNWGWQKQYKYSKKDSSTIYSNYTALFDTLIPDLLNSRDPYIPYWPSSPSIGWGHKESLLQGDSHYWGIWWGMEPFENYERKFGRFMSEYGFQGMPSYHSLSSVCSKDSLVLFSSELKAHQKHPTGFETISTYMKRDLPFSSDPKTYIYLSQILQRKGMRTAIETHRRNKPFCMGTLFWQMNDCWPGISWSAFEYNAIPKAFAFDLKELYDPIMLSVHKERDSISVYIISDSAASVKGTLELNWHDLHGHIATSQKIPVTVEAFKSNVYAKLPTALLDAYSPNEHYLKCSFRSESGKIIRTKLHFFEKEKNLSLKKSEIHLELINGGNTLKVWSTTFVKDLYLYSDSSTPSFNINFIDLEANKKYEIHLHSKLKDLSAVKWITINDVLHATKPSTH